MAPRRVNEVPANQPQAPDRKELSSQELQQKKTELQSLQKHSSFYKSSYEHLHQSEPSQSQGFRDINHLVLGQPVHELEHRADRKIYPAYTEGLTDEETKASLVGRWDLLDHLLVEGQDLKGLGALEPAFLIPLPEFEQEWERVVRVFRKKHSFDEGHPWRKPFTDKHGQGLMERRYPKEERAKNQLAKLTDFFAVEEEKEAAALTPESTEDEATAILLSLGLGEEEKAATILLSLGIAEEEGAALPQEQVAVPTTAAERTGSIEQVSQPSKRTKPTHKKTPAEGWVRRSDRRGKGALTENETEALKKLVREEENVSPSEPHSSSKPESSTEPRKVSIPKRKSTPEKTANKVVKRKYTKRKKGALTKKQLKELDVWMEETTHLLESGNAPTQPMRRVNLKTRATGPRRSHVFSVGSAPLSPQPN